MPRPLRRICASAAPKRPTQSTTPAPGRTPTSPTTGRPRAACRAGALNVSDEPGAAQAQRQPAAGEPAVRKRPYEAHRGHLDAEGRAVFEVVPSAHGGCDAEHHGGDLFEAPRFQRALDVIGQLTHRSANELTMASILTFARRQSPQPRCRRAASTLLRAPVKHPNMPERSRPAAHAAALVDFSPILFSFRGSG
jgi:hypothetical protein